MIKNKKGMSEIAWLFILFVGVLIIGFLASIIIAVLNWGSSVVTPVAENLGMIDNINASAIGKTTFGTLDTIIGMLPLLVGFAYVMLLIGSIVLVLSYKANANPLFIGLFFAFMILIILTAILSSNAYQDLYEGNDEIALELQSQTMLSFLILRSPYIFSIVGFICGIFLFSGRQNETYQTGDGY